MPKQRSRPTLTYSQMYGGTHAGMMEGKGIFSKIGKWLKKTKVLSRLAKIAGPVIGVLPFPGARIAGTAVGIAGKVAEMKGFGLRQKIKSITRNQIESIKRGLGRLMADGSISLAKAKKLFPKIKNVTKTQLRALAAFRGRHMKGGGVSLAGGRATGMTGMGFSGGGVLLPKVRQNVRLQAGRGVKLAGTGGRRRKSSRNSTGQNLGVQGRGQPLIGGRKKARASRVLVVPRF